LSKAIVKKIVSQAIKNNFRMLCILNDFKEINYSKIGNWEYRFETRANHTYPQLKVCYLDYRRKILQIMLL
jgi:hypothetical protein